MPSEEKQVGRICQNTHLKVSLEAAGGWESESTSDVMFGVLSELGSVSLVSITSGLTSNSNNSSVNGARDAILLLDVNLS